MTSSDPIFRAPNFAAPERPTTREYTVLGRDDSEIRILGQLLAHGTSQRDDHAHGVNVNVPLDHPSRFANKNERCSACRWFELDIYEVAADIAGDGGEEPPSARYLVATAGRTVVPGEVNFRRAEYTDSPYDVVEMLVQYRDGTGAETGGQRFIPQTSARALAQAAAYDTELRDAYLSFQRGRAA